MFVYNSRAKEDSRAHLLSQKEKAVTIYSAALRTNLRRLKLLVQHIYNRWEPA